MFGCLSFVLGRMLGMQPGQVLMAAGDRVLAPGAVSRGMRQMLLLHRTVVTRRLGMRMAALPVRLGAGLLGFRMPGMPGYLSSMLGPMRGVQPGQMLVAAGDRVLAPSMVVVGRVNVAGLRSVVSARMGGMPIGSVPVLLGRLRGVGPRGAAPGGEQQANDSSHQGETTIAIHR